MSERIFLQSRGLLSGTREAACTPIPLQADHSCFLASARTKLGVFVGTASLSGWRCSAKSSASRFKRSAEILQAAKIDQENDHQRSSSLIPARFTTSAQRATSSRMKASNCSGVVVLVSTVRDVRCF